MAKSLTVSIVMAVHNGGEFLSAAVQSIREQTLVDWEAVILDDGSTDSTAAVLERAKKCDSRFRIHRTSRQGQTRALNQALRCARGQFIARLDADDVMDPTRLELQHTFLRRHPTVALLGSDAWIINRNGRRVGRIRMPTDDHLLRSELIRGNPFIHSAVMVRADVMHDAGGYDERFLPAQDYELWMRVAANHKIASLATPLLSLRKHEGNMSRYLARRQVVETITVQLGALQRHQYPWMDIRHTLKWMLRWLHPALVERAVQIVKGV